MKFVRGDALDFDPRAQMSRLFVEGFFNLVQPYSSDKERLAATFSHIFKIEHFYLAVEGERVAAMVSCTDETTSPVELKLGEFCKNLGFFAGIYAFFALNKYLTGDLAYSEKLRKTGIIEYVTTDPEFRGQGIAKKLLSHVIEAGEYGEYTLEVADTNTAAIAIYKSLCFVEFRQSKNKSKENPDSKFLLHMKFRKL